MREYADYIQQLPHGQAGRLRIGDDEKLPIVRRRLVVAAKALAINLVIKRSGNDVYFWWENGGDEQPRSKRRYTRRRREDAETIPSDQPVDELGMVEQGIPEERQTFPEEESPELGQTPL
jgi:hypothetical protein